MEPTHPSENLLNVLRWKDGRAPPGNYNLASLTMNVITLPAGVYDGVILKIRDGQSVKFQGDTVFTSSSSIEIIQGGLKEPDLLSFDNASVPDIDEAKIEITPTITRGIDFAIKNYPNIALSEDRNSFDVSKLTEVERQALGKDIDFSKKNAWVPQENIFSNLTTYHPTNNSQQIALDSVREFIVENSSKASALVLQGTPGLGKTHLLIAAAKELSEDGRDAVFVTKENAFNVSASLKSSLPKGAIWVFDDVNDRYQHNIRFLVEVLLHVHDHGGKILISSNSSDFGQLLYAEIMGDSSRGDKARISDRFSTMVAKSLTLFGESYRSKQESK